MRCFKMQQITPKLFQGNMEDALQNLNNTKIDIIIYLGQQIPLKLCFNCQSTLIHIPLNDGKNSLSKLRNLLFLTYIISTNDKTILIACRAGISRSILLTTSIYALQKKIDFDKAYQQIKEQIPQSFPELHLLQEMKQITEELTCCL